MQKRIIIFGSTGLLGFQITKKLLEAGHSVRVYVRSRDKLMRLFKEKTNDFDMIVQGQLTDLDTVNKLFENSQNDPIDYVISALGARPQDKGQVQTIQYRHQVNIAWQCKKNQAKKLILMSAALMERPYHPFAAFLNTLIPDVFHWKSQAENHVRQLGIDYAIIRPPYLSDANELTGYVIGQGDKLLGKITRITVGNIVRDLIQTDKVPSRVTFECSSSETSRPEERDFGSLREDTESNIITCNHRRAKFIWWFMLFLVLLGVIGLIVYLVK